MTTYIATTAQPVGEPVTVVITNPATQQRAAKRLDKWRNQPQSHAMAAASLIFIAGGMDLALGLGWNVYTYVETTYQFQYCWFVGLIAGAFVSSFLVNVLPKRVFYGIGGLFILITGIIFTSAPYNYAAIIAARYICGIGVGLTTVPFIIHSGEISAKTYRGYCTATEQYGLSLGIALQMIYASQWTAYTNYANQLHGIMGIILGALALGSLTVTRESPIFYLRRNEEAQALAAQRSLMREFGTTDISNAAFDENKCYVIEGTNRPMGAMIGEAVMPFIKLLLYRVFVAFTYSLPLTYTLMVSSDVTDYYDYTWPRIVCGVLRMLGSLVAIFTLDNIGRKLSSLLALTCMAALMLSMAGISSDYSNYFSPYYMTVVCRLSMAFSFFAGLFTPSTTTYLSEAFPMRLKPFLIMLCVCIEQIVHIIVICTFNGYVDSLYTYLVTVGIILVVGLILFAVVMPETRGITLREAGYRFRRVHDIMAY